MKEIGDIYYRGGEGVPGDVAEAKRWYEKVAAAGNSRAMTDIGSSYYYGYPPPVDVAEAKRWYEKAAALGDQYAQSSTR